MMVTIVVLFTICWAPFHTVHMLFDYCKYGRSGWTELRAAGGGLKTPPAVLCFPADNLEEKYDDVTLHMIIAVVQAIGFFNSFNNPIVYAFMNENFKKSCVSTLSNCLRKPNPQTLAGAAVGVAGGPGGAAPKLNIQFIRPQCREAFVLPREGRSPERAAPGLANQDQASSSHQDSSTMETKSQKICTMQTELPGSSSSHVK